MAAPPRKPILAVVSPFIDKRHGTERRVAEWTSRLTADHDVHVYSQRVEDLDLTALTWHRIPKLPGPHLGNFIWWLAANHIWRWWDRAFRGIRHDLVFTAGTAVFHLDQSGTIERVSATADSTGAVNMLFPVVDRFQSGFDVHTGCSTGFNKQIQEGRRKIASDLNFDYQHGKQMQNERNLVKGTATRKEANVPACVTESSASFLRSGA